MHALRVHFASPTAEHGAGGDDAQTIKPDGSVEADHGRFVTDLHAILK
jgi:hypothetical protein